MTIDALFKDLLEQSKSLIPQTSLSSYLENNNHKKDNSNNNINSGAKKINEESLVADFPTIQRGFEQLKSQSRHLALNGSPTDSRHININSNNNESTKRNELDQSSAIALLANKGFDTSKLFDKIARLSQS